MYDTGTKKMLNMLILDILREYSDEEHRLLQQDIIDLLDSKWRTEEWHVKWFLKWKGPDY